MTQINSDASRNRGHAIRQARARRVRSIRRRVVAGAVAVFLASWLLIAVVLVSGNDPALARKTSTVAAVSGTSGSSGAGTTTTSGTTTTTTGSNTTTAGAGTTSNANSGSSATSSVTTRQS